MNVDEKERLQALRRYAILDTPPEPRFDRLTRLAARLFQAPFAAIVLVDEYRLWFKSRYGALPVEASRDSSFCTHTIQSDQVLAVPDTRLDPRFAESVLAPGEPVVRFYAGAPLVTPQGHRIGTLCVMDTDPRPALDLEAAANLADLAGLVVDELELGLAESARTEAERLFESVFATVPIGISVTDAAGTLLHVNPAYCRLFGYTAAELLGQSVFRLFLDEEERERARRAHSEFLAGTAPMPDTWRLRTRDGEILELYLNSSLLRGPNGKPLRVTAVSDLTGIRRTTAALRESHERLRQMAAIIESSDDGIVGTRLGGVVTSWNAGAERIYGYSAAEMLGRSIEVILPEELRGEITQLEERLKRGEPVVGHEAVRVRKDGRRIHVSVTLSPIRDDQGGITGLSAVVRDITERKLLEEQLIHSQKMEAVALLAGGVAHDFNNLLTIIIGYGRMLSMEAEPGGVVQEFTEEILHSANRASALTGQLLAFSRRQVAQPRVLNLNDIVQSMHRFLTRILGEQVELITHTSPDLGQIKADPGHVEQVIANLAVNARDAMPHGGKLTIEVANVELLAAVVRYRPGLSPGRYVMLAVSDTGCGMTPEVQSRIFEPFFTTKDKGKGTGLGLSIIHGLVKQSGGDIWVSSELGRGSEFKIYLPRIFENAEALHPPAEGLPMPSGTETILVVEDEDPVRKLVSGILTRCGYRVLQASNGNRALELCNSMHEPIHLMVTDVVMPGMAGPDLARAVKILRPETRIIFMSGYTENSVLQHDLIDPDTNFLQKPFTPEVFAQRVREALDRGSKE
jgi:PAS domain S-box-containing protein